MNERSPKSEPAEDKALFDLGRLHPLLEIVAVDLFCLPSVGLETLRGRVTHRQRGASVHARCSAGSDGDGSQAGHRLGQRR